MPKELDFSDDIKKLKENIPELADLSDKYVADLYSNYSEEKHCAGWIILYDSPETYEYFRYWLITPPIQVYLDYKKGV